MSKKLGGTIGQRSCKNEESASVVRRKQTVSPSCLFFFVSLLFLVFLCCCNRHAAAALWAQQTGSHAPFLAAFGWRGKGLNSLSLAGSSTLGGKLSVCLRHTFKHVRPTNVWMPDISRVECGRWKQAPLTHLYLLCYFPQQRLRC